MLNFRFMGRILLASMVAVSTGCSASASFVLTGEARQALAGAAKVQPFLTGLPAAAYEEIGVVEVRGHDLEARVKRAVEVARTKGGNGIILLGSKTHVQGNSFYGGGLGWAGPGAFPGWGVYGGYGIGAAGASDVRSFEVERYAIVYVDPTGPKGTRRPAAD